MPNWKKLITSGSDATLNSLYVTNAVTASVVSSSYIDLDVLSNGDIPPHKAGRIFFGAEDGALEVYNEEADITLQVGQEFFVRAYNKSGGTILNGTPVRASGSQGDRIAIYPALAEDHSTGTHFDSHIIGLATHNIGPSSEGYVTAQGIVRGVDTQAFSAGDTLYLQTGSAGLRNSPPPFPYDIVQVGYASKIASNGFVFVEPKEPVHFNNISGLSGSASSPGDLWIYQANNSFSPGKTLSGSYTIDNGNLNVDGDITGSGLNLTSIPNAGTDTDKFLVLDSSNNVDFRTGAEVRSDIGAGTGDGTVTGTGTNNQVMTSTGGTGIQGEANLTFDGSTLKVTGGITGSTTLTIGSSQTNTGTSSSIAGGCSNTNSGNCSFIGGGRLNNIASNVNTSVIAGGFTNTICSNHLFASILGGRDNTVDTDYGVIGGGYLNDNFGTFSIIGGGCANTVCSGEQFSAILGGRSNLVDGDCSVVVGGYLNCARASGAFVGGGYTNDSCGACSTIGGGYDNCSHGAYTIIGGGRDNYASALYATIVGGFFNCARGACSFVGGGRSNDALGSLSVIAGGTLNTASAACSFIGGGCLNNITGNFSSVLGGFGNAVCSQCSFIGGGSNNHITVGSIFSNIIGGSTHCITNQYSTIAGGFNNTLLGSAASSSIAGGMNNSSACRNTHIIGSNLTADKANYTFVNNLDVEGTVSASIFSGSYVGDGSSLSGLCQGTVTGTGTDNQVMTSTGGTGIQGETLLTFDGTQLKILSGNSALATFGVGHTNSGYQSSILGGSNNCISSACADTVIVGGTLNTASAACSFIGGGNLNYVSSACGVVVGGQSNRNDVDSGASFMGAGCGNCITNDSLSAVLVGGDRNRLDNSEYGVIVGGDRNQVFESNHAIIVGGILNTASAACSFIGGGARNYINTAAISSSIVGGFDNTTNLSNTHIIGSGITADKANYTFVNNLDVETNIIGSTISLTGLANQASEATAVMINGSNVVGTRELGSNAFNSTAFTTCTGTVTSVGGTGTVSGITLSGTVTTSGNLTLGGTFSTTTSSITDFNTGVGTIVDGCGFTTCTGDITGVTAGSGLTGGATSGNATLNIGAGTGITVNADDIALDYLGTNNFIDSATNLEGTAIAFTDTIIYHDATDNNVKKGLVSDIPFTNNTGTVTNVTVGVGLDVEDGTTTPDITLDLSEFSSTTTFIGTDEFIVLDGNAERKIAASNVNLSIFNNDSNFSSCTGTVTGTGTDNQVMTSTGGTGIQGEANLTFNGSTLSVNGNIGLRESDFLILDNDGDAFSYIINDASDNFGYGAFNNIYATPSNTHVFVNGEDYALNDIQAGRLKIGGSHTLSSNCSSIAGGECNVINTDANCSFIGGGLSNVICATETFSTIGGGRSNQVDGDYGVVVGGYLNCARGNCAFVGGGYTNDSAGSWSTTGGGYDNCSHGSYATVGGGRDNYASTTYATVVGGYFNCARGVCSFVGGGYSNDTVGTFSVIAGGYNNTNNENCSFIGGGANNTITGTGCCHIIVGGGVNCINSTGDKNTVSGGGGNDIITNVHNSTIGGGAENIICRVTGTDYGSTIGGGAINSILESQTSTIGGGCQNLITGADHTTIAGGHLNTGSGACSFIGGGCANNICSGETFAVIGGGRSNIVDGDYSSVVGGYVNCTNGNCSFIGGGFSNYITGGTTNAIVSGCDNYLHGNNGTCVGNFIGGGATNCLRYSQAATIVGGCINCINSNSCGFIGGGQQNCLAGRNHSVIVGGFNNTVSTGCYASIVGGQSNCISSACYGFIGGGCSNCICCQSRGGTIAGGTTNSLTCFNCNSIIGGGISNCMTTSCCAVIGGGRENCASNSCYAFIGGGIQNCICNESAYSAIGGGYSNVIQNSSCCSAILGGYNNTINGHSCSFIVGHSLTTTTTATTYMNNATVACHLQVGGTTTLNTTTGRIDATNDVISFATSDRRLKENIQPIENALCKVIGVSGNTFDWKPLTKEEIQTIHGNSGRDVGVIAQEIESILPEAVTTRDSGYKAVNYEKIIPLLIEAIKDQQKQIDELKSKL